MLNTTDPHNMSSTKILPQVALEIHDTASENIENIEECEYLMHLNDSVTSRGPNQMFNENIFKEQEQANKGDGFNANVFGSSTKITEVIKPTNGVLLTGDKIQVGT
jgi:hypothetical protein